MEQSLRMQGACREWADQWPIMHADYQADTIGVMAELERRACPLDNQGNDSEAHVAPGRQGAPALVCRGAGVLQ